MNLADIMEPLALGFLARSCAPPFALTEFPNPIEREGAVQARDEARVLRLQ
jgi:hypothetical protein